MSNQIETAARRRQMILDHLWLNPGASMADIGALLFEDGVSRSRHHNTVRTMIEWREIRYEGVPRCRRYWAIVKATRPAETAKRMREANIKGVNRWRLNPGRRMPGTILGRYIHTPGSNKHGIPGRGGQGAVRQTVYVSCQT